MACFNVNPTWAGEQSPRRPSRAFEPGQIPPNPAMALWTKLNESSKWSNCNAPKSQRSQRSPSVNNLRTKKGFTSSVAPASSGHQNFGRTGGRVSVEHPYMIELWVYNDNDNGRVTQQALRFQPHGLKTQCSHQRKVTHTDTHTLWFWVQNQHLPLN